MSPAERIRNASTTRRHARPWASNDASSQLGTSRRPKGARRRQSVRTAASASNAADPGSGTAVTVTLNDACWLNGVSANVGPGPV